MKNELGTGVFYGSAELRLATGGLRVTESSYAAGTVLPAHSHETAHFCFVLEGAYHERIGRSNEEERTARSLVWHPAGIDHSERHDVAGRHLLIELDSTWLEQIGDGGAKELNEPLDLTSVRARALASSIEREARHREAGVELAIEGAVLGLVALGMREGHSGHARRRGWNEPSWMKRVDEYLRARVAERVCLADVAMVAGVHPTHVARAWRHHRGCTLGDEHRRIRVELACTLLRDGRESLAAVAQQCGFVDQAHFGRVFKAWMGRPPGAFRRESQTDSRSARTKRVNPVQDGMDSCD